VETVFNIVFDLLLYAITEKYYALPEMQFTKTRLELFFEKVLPLIPEIIAFKPISSIGKLFNAGVNLQDKSKNFYENLIKVSEFLTIDNLEAVGALVAWIVGEARLRDYVIKILDKIEPKIILKLANLENINNSNIQKIASYIIRAIKNDKWRTFKKSFSTNIMTKLRMGEEIPQDIINKDVEAVTAWKERSLVVLSDIGGFYGFGGFFRSPPRLIWGENDSIIAYTRNGEIYIIHLDGHGNKKNRFIVNDLESLAYHPKIGFVCVNKKGEIVNLTTNKQYSEIIKGSRKIFAFCSSYTTPEQIYIVHKEKEIIKIQQNGINKTALEKKYDSLTVSNDGKLYFINTISEKGVKTSYIAELLQNGKVENMIKVAIKGHLRIVSPYAYIFKEPDRLYIYNLNDKTDKLKLKLPIEIKACTSFLVNQREMYLTSKFSYHIICIGINPYSN